MEYKSFFKQVQGNEGNLCIHNVRLDTYGCGCGHDCRYCYAKSLLEFRNLWNPKTPSVADFEKIKRKINTLKNKGFNEVLRLGGMTDCLQPIEATNKITFKTIEALNEANIGYLIVTKSHIIANDEYLNVLNPKLAHVQISITSTDDKFALTYENCSLVSKRLHAFKILQDSGIDCSLRISPFVSEFINPSIIAEYFC